jgi:hypothetical protein
MMFALNRCGTPSHAAWVRVGTTSGGGGAPGAPPGARPGPAACGATDVPPGAPPANPGGDVVPSSFTPPGPIVEPKPRVKRPRIEAPRITRRQLRARERMDVVVHVGRPGPLRVRVLVLRRGRPHVVFGSRTVRVQRAARVRVAIRASRAGLAALRRPGRVTLRIEATSTAAGTSARTFASHRL